MTDNIISYIEMCRREALSLQAGMNFGVGGNHSVILMSVRRNAPYRDRIEEGGTTLIYEGHDQPRGRHLPDPKTVDQVDVLPSGSLTQNGQVSSSGARRQSRAPSDVPFSRGGTSMTAANVQLLCARHNLEKHDSIV